MKRLFLFALVICSLTICACENKTAEVETPEETLVIEEPEVTEIETEEVDPEEKECGPRPDFILLNEDGSYYEPQHVTLEDIEKRIDEMGKQPLPGGYTGYKNDWDRDRFVALLINFNGPYMDQEDVKTLYADYLGNFGYANFDDTRWKLFWYDESKYKFYHREFDFGDVFIDPRLSEEAKRIYSWYFKNYHCDSLANYYYKEIHPKVDYSNKNFYTPALESLMDFMVFDIGYEEMNEYNENATTRSNFSQWMFEEIYPDYKDVKSDYEIKDYVSSHSTEKDYTKQE